MSTSWVCQHTRHGTVSGFWSHCMCPCAEAVARCKQACCGRRQRLCELITGNCIVLRAREPLRASRSWPQAAFPLGFPLGVTCFNAVATFSILAAFHPIVQYHHRAAAVHSDGWQQAGGPHDAPAAGVWRRGGAAALPAPRTLKLAAARLWSKPIACPGIRLPPHLSCRCRLTPCFPPNPLPPPASALSLRSSPSNTPPHLEFRHPGGLFVGRCRWICCFMRGSQASL